MKTIIPLLYLFLIYAFASCSGGSAADALADLRQAEAAVAAGDMEVARSIASRLTSDDHIAKLPASQLARLSMVYMQMADSTDREANIAQATDLYRQAYRTSPDSAAAYYAEVTPDMYPYVAMLRSIAGRLDNPYTPEADSVDEASSLNLPESDSIR